MFKQRHQEYFNVKKADIYKTRNLLVRDKDKNFEQFVSKL